LQFPQCIGSELVSKQPVLHETRLGPHWQTLFTHISPGLHIIPPHITAPLEDELEVAVVDVDPVEVEPVEVDVVLVAVDGPPPPPPPEVEIEPVDVEPLDVVPPPVAVVDVLVELKAPVPLVTVVPPQPACASSAAAASIRGTDRADRCSVMTNYLREAWKQGSAARSIRHEATGCQES
jgi:hypothetical protein